jgi:antirestriction protein ArdC
MRVEEARKMADGALQQLGVALERGHSEMLKAYLAALGRFHRYSLRNALLIAAQRPDARQVAGFHTWRRLGRVVRKGEHGIAILAPIVRRKQDAPGTTEDETSRQPHGPPTTEADEDVVAFRGAYVFDISQTEGRPLPEFSRVGGDPGTYLERLKSFVQQRNIALASTEHLGGADGASIGGRILIRTGLAPAEQLATLAHECAHELMHISEDQARPDRSVRELEAEAVAFAVCCGVAVGDQQRRSADRKSARARARAASDSQTQRIRSRVRSLGYFSGTG